MRVLTPWMTEEPTRVGWYNASTERDENTRRYWHGGHWSAPVYVGDPDRHADRARDTMGETQSGIEWRGIFLVGTADVHSLAQEFIGETLLVYWSPSREKSEKYVEDGIATLRALGVVSSQRIELVKAEARRMDAKFRRLQAENDD